MEKDEMPPVTLGGRWTGLATQMLEEQDDLSLVYGMTRQRRSRLRKSGVLTRAQLLETKSVKGGAPEVLSKLK